MDKTVYTVDIRKLEDYEGSLRDFAYVVYNEKKLNTRMSKPYKLHVDVYDDGKQKSRFKSLLKKYGASEDYIKEVLDAGKKETIKESMNKDNKDKQDALFESARSVAEGLVAKYGEKTKITVDDILETITDAIDYVFLSEFSDIEASEIDWESFYDMVDAKVKEDNDKGLSLGSIEVFNADDLAYLVYILTDEEDKSLFDVDDALAESNYTFQSGEHYSDLTPDSIPDCVSFYQGWEESDNQEIVPDEDEQSSVDDTTQSDVTDPDLVDEGFCYALTEDLINESKQEARRELMRELERDGRLAPVNEGRDLPKPSKAPKGANPTRTEYRSFISADKKAISEDIAEIKTLLETKTPLLKELQAAANECDVKKVKEVGEKLAGEAKKKSNANRINKLVSHIVSCVENIINIKDILDAAKKTNESVTARFAQGRKMFESGDDNSDDNSGSDNSDDADKDNKSDDSGDKKDDDNKDNDDSKKSDDSDEETIDGDRVKVTFTISEGHERDEVVEQIKKDLEEEGIKEDGVEVLDPDGDESDEIQIVVDGEYIKELQKFCDARGIDIEEKLGGSIEVDDDEDSDKDSDDKDKGDDDSSDDSGLFSGDMLDDIFGTDIDSDNSQDDNQQK